MPSDALPNTPPINGDTAMPDQRKYGFPKREHTFPPKPCGTCGGKKKIDFFEGKDKDGKPIIKKIKCPDC